ncbi:class I SAM-dependent methyltransferase [Chitinimonas sp. BJYL2]|uniref:class I SAM-dependent methyltransferase n=1 Tax=Chitinimonas sp. BJYL2 TaxID=2976696 RepID=UPI0022B4B6D3|nr:class I SAM-dependent methyltransferase [Chitinimonas sp. BJYL2]
MTVPLHCPDVALRPHALLLAERYGFALLDALPLQGHALQLAEDGLALLTLGPAAPGPVRVDFASGAAEWRRKHGGGRGQAIARACGLKGGATPRVLDATAGLGKDGFALASLGCEIDLIERSPIAAALLEDGLLRAAAHPEVATIAAKLHLHRGVATGLMANWQGEQPDVIYLDPMFPDTKRKSALSKKEMQAFQAVVGADEDADALLAPARALARAKVVVKRPRHAPLLAGLKPAYALEGDSVRFDVYLPA